jgi:hypothetical protein
LTPEEKFQFTTMALERYFAPPSADLESKGWEVWLKTIWPFWFSEEFSKEHAEYWELRWRVLHQIRRGETPDPKDTVAMLLLGRGLGKSACVEASRIMRGSILGGGYSLIISETDDQATEHLGNCRILIDHPDSRLVEFYPEMSVADNADALKGMPTTDRKEMFICRNGYILRAKGLTAKMRGLRVGVHRPNDIALDDIDDVNDSLAVSLNKLRLITASILPVLARDNPTIDCGQNLIGEHSVMNQIYTGKTDALAERTVIGPTPAFTHLDIESRIDETGKLRHVILPTSTPSWSGLDIRRAQTFLNNSGLETFRAEYQNEFDQFRSGKVISNYDESRQIINWSQFESMYGQRRIPSHWDSWCGLDVGYSEGQYPHYSAWVFIATSAANSKTPGKVFVYRSRTFKGTSIDDQGEAIKKAMWRDENVTMWKMSHEKTGEMMTLNQKHGFIFSKFTHYKAEDGVAQWQHFSRVDPEKKNTFHDIMGDCQLFYIVEDGQEKIAKNDDGHRLLRDQVSTWEYVPVKVTDSGQTVQKPSKINDDACDALKGLMAYFQPGITERTYEEIAQEKYEKATIYATPEYKDDHSIGAQMSRSMAQSKVLKEMKEEGLDYDDAEYAGIDISGGY